MSANDVLKSKSKYHNWFKQNHADADVIANADSW